MSGTSEEYSAYSDASHEYYQSRGQKYNLRPRRREVPTPSAKTPKKLSREIYDKNISSTFPSPGRIVTQYILVFFNFLPEDKKSRLTV